jgi:hypothetical protein
MRGAAVTVLLAAAATGLPQGDFKGIFSALTGSDEPGEGSDSEKVPYTTLKRFDGYELRQYPSVKWVCTEVTYKGEVVDEGPAAGGDWDIIKAMQQMMSGSSWKKRPENKMFMKLFRYISGVNKEQEEVAMTVPVLSRMRLLADNMVNKQMCFYLEKKHQAKPPTPVDPEVKIEQNKEFTVYVHTFGGYAMKDAVNIREAKKFAEVLRIAGEKVDTSLFYTAGYDSPMKFWNRKNEVMYLSMDNDL